MAKENSGFLPHILHTLIEKPRLCETYENLCNEIKFVVSAQSVQNLEIEKGIESALNEGQHLGILTCTNDVVRMPFNFKKTTKIPKAETKDMREDAIDSEKDEINIAQPTDRMRRKKRNVRSRSGSRRRVSRRRSQSKRRR